LAGFRKKVALGEVISGTLAYRAIDYKIEASTKEAVLNLVD